MGKKTASKWIITSIVGVSFLGIAPQLSEASPSHSTYSEELKALNSSEESAEEALLDVVSLINETEVEAELLVEEMERTAENLEKIQKNKIILTEKIEQREAKLESQARSVQVSGQSQNVLSFLLEAESVIDIVGRLDAVHTLVSANHKLMENQIQDIEEVEEIEKITMEKREEQTLLAAKLETKKAELEEKQLEQEALVASIAAEKASVEEKSIYLSQQLESERRYEEMRTAQLAANASTTETISEEKDSNTVSTSSKDQATVSSPVSGSLINAAHSVTGVRYSYGGSTTSGFDCSGYTQYVFNKTGKTLPRSAAAQFGASHRLPLSEAKPGDLIFFNQSGSIDHVGIYLGGGKFIGAQTSTGVAVASFTSGYWSRYVAGFGRP